MCLATAQKIIDQRLVVTSWCLFFFPLQEMRACENFEFRISNVPVLWKCITEVTFHGRDVLGTLQYIKVSFLDSISKENYPSYLVYHSSVLLLTCVNNKKLRILTLAKKKVIMFYTSGTFCFCFISPQFKTIYNK